MACDLESGCQTLTTCQPLSSSASIASTISQAKKIHQLALYFLLTMISELYMARSRSPSNMASSNSAGSFDFTLLLKDDMSLLMDVSLSMESLSSIASDEAIPPFPTRPMALMSPLLLETPSLMFPVGRGHPEADDIVITHSVPTSPRMTRMLTEPLRVAKWVVCPTTYLVHLQYT